MLGRPSTLALQHTEPAHLGSLHRAHCAHRATLCFIAPCVLHCAALCCTVLCCLCCTVLCCIVLHCTVLHCAALHCAALCCTLLHCTLLTSAAPVAICSQPPLVMLSIGISGIEVGCWRVGWMVFGRRRVKRRAWVALCTHAMPDAAHTTRTPAARAPATARSILGARRDTFLTASAHQ